ncbi:MAG TPA: SDR family oxidoreductase [Defluviitaleaceae bacterium]|nr:SDR family oxidoreductase [Defluviitaleaceae bacterium]
MLVLGSSGMLGHVVVNYFEEKNYNVYNLSHRIKINEKTKLMDVTNFHEFDNYLKGLNLDVIINCIGILNQVAEQNPDKAILLNSYLPRFLEKKYSDAKTKIIQISTDCVFSGKTGNYREDSFKDGETIYARTKALGEIDNEKDLTIRTSIIGPDINENGIGLFHWFMKQKNSIYGYKNAFWTGVTTIELAKGIEALVQNNVTGLYHFVPNTKISKFDLLNIFNEVFDKKITILPQEDYVVDKSLINTRKDFSYNVPDYKEMIEEMKNWIDIHANLYNY